MGMDELALVAAVLGIASPFAVDAQSVYGTVRSDTMVVRSVGNGVWGGAQAAHEELRVGGGAAATEFGSLDCFTALPDGGVAVFDSKGRDGPVIHVFDSNGRLRRSLGRGGSGPGEIGARARPFCLAATRVGTILMLDHSNNRVNRWSADGKALPSISLPPGVGGLPPYILPGPNGSVFIRVALARPRSGAGMDLGAFSFVRVGDDGRILDTLRRSGAAQKSTVPRVFDPVVRRLPLPDGRFVTSGSDRLAFLVEGPNAGAGVLFTERAVERIPIWPEERREIEAELAFTTAQTKGMAPNPGVAGEKAATSDMMVDVEGRIWFQRNVPAVKGELVYPPSLPGQPKPPGQSYSMPPVFVAFKSDGAYLGEVRLPLAQGYLQNFGFTGSYIWGVLTNAEDLPVLVKWHIPGAGTR